MTPCIDCTLLTDRVVTVDGREVARCEGCAGGIEIPVPEGAKWPTVVPESVTS